MIAHYVTFPSEGGNNRFCYILDLLKKEKNNDIELITSDFRHGTKKKHDINKKDIDKLGYKVTFIHEPMYKKNIGLKRIFSAKVLARNTKKYLNNLSVLPDVIYCAVPSLDIAKEAAKFAKRNKIRFIIDIQDLWPEAFKMVFNVPILSNLLFYPSTQKANYIYSSANNIIAVSETYKNRAISKKSIDKKGISVFLGTDMNKFDAYSKNNNKNTQTIKIAYIGTLGHSYDIKQVIDAIKIENKKGRNNIEFIVMGNGPLREEFEKYALLNKINCTFTGRLAYSEMVNKLSSCDIAVNPIRKGAAQSIINKVGDYASAGLPVINTQECKEYKSLIKKYHAGINCENNPQSIAKAIETLIEDEKEYRLMSKGNKRMAMELFDRAKTYETITKCIMQKDIK